MLRPKMNPWVGLGLLSFGATLCAGTLPSSSPKTPAELAQGTVLHRALREGESHEYRLALASGAVVEALVEQEKIDISLSLAGPGLGTLLKVDSPTGTEGAERLFALIEVGGMYRLRVEAAVGKTPGLRGSYGLRLAKPRTAGPQDRARAQAWRKYSEGEKLRRRNAGEDQRQALDHYGEAIRLWQALGADQNQQAIALYRRAAILWARGDLPGAVASHKGVLVLAEDPRLRVSALNLLTLAYIGLGDTQQALETAEQARELAPRAGDPDSHASALNNLGKIYRRWGDADRALEYFEEALEKWRESGANEDMALTFLNQADVYLAIGNPEPAFGRVSEALQVMKETGAPNSEGEADRLRGLAHGQLGSLRIALAYLSKARTKARDAGKPVNEAQALNDMGSILLDLGDLEQAHAVFQEAGRIARESRHSDNEAFSLSGLGKVLLAKGDAAGAIRLFDRSEKIYRALGDPISLAQVLQGRVRAERKLERIAEALASTDRALELVEALREGVGRHDLRSQVIGARADLYDLRVDLLLRLDEQTPGQGLDAMAFAASEWRRARSLLDMVKRMGPGLPRDLSPKSLQRQRDLRIDLQRLAEEKLKAGSGAKPQSGGRGLPEIEREIQEAVAQWEALSEEMRRQSPAYAAVAAPKLVGVPEVQKLLDADTALVAYTVGEERSILWWIEKDSLEVHHDLPDKATLKPLVERAYDLVSKRPQTRQSRQQEEDFEQLGKILLGPVAHRLPRVRRIAIVADEVLQTLPFEALTVPGTGEPLVESHATVQLPSASLAAALRERASRRATPPQTLIVFGAPEFGTSKTRPLASLPFSREEAETILKMVPEEKSRGLLSFEANRDAALSSDLGGYRFIHFATHGIVDPENPNLSGIQLSRIDPQGRPLEGEGILPFYEVYNLSLPADLVTLSACRTAVGPQVRGEGPLGMSRSFLYAGASRVLGTLWDVDDRDAETLMVLFYQGLLQDGKPPAVALQDAQKAMRAQEKTSAPYHWAGFVLQGDWR